MQSPGSLAKKLRAFADDLPRQSNEIKKAAVLEVLTQIVPYTPKATGQAQANYITSLGAADSATVRPGPGSGDTSIARGRSVIQGAQPGQSINITNNLPYIGLLNNGSSKQAPAGFIQAGCERARQLIRRQRVRWKV